MRRAEPWLLTAGLYARLDSFGGGTHAAMDYLPARLRRVYGADESDMMSMQELFEIAKKRARAKTDRKNLERAKLGLSPLSYKE